LTVQIVDGSGNVVTSSSALVTVALGSNPGGATLGGTTTVNAVNGVATFGDLTLDKPGHGYTLTASSPGLSGATSSGFDESNVAKHCNENDVGSGPCTTTLTSSRGNSSTVTASPSSSGNAGNLSESVNIPTTHPLDCSPALYGGYTSVGPDTWLFSMNPSTNRSEVWTETMKRPFLPLRGTIYAILHRPQVCYGSIHPFAVSRGGINGMAAPGTLPDGQAGFIGTLPNCPVNNGPCIDQAHVTRTLDLASPIGFDITVPVDVPPGQGDPARH
jgi:hypothetical protein